MLIRHGIRLSPRKADLFDMIERATKAGTHISSDALAEIFCPSSDCQQGRDVVKTTVHQINGLLQETDLVICCERGDGYWLGKRP
jgi:hypothetical protein